MSDYRFEELDICEIVEVMQQGHCPRRFCLVEEHNESSARLDSPQCQDELAASQSGSFFGLIAVGPEIWCVSPEDLTITEDEIKR